ncbi:hypothetical protein [Mesorhizobium sp.]|uniref:hypothetical protein n=1 Tax=Mesorhizobium sp. TaxID=1871066 RepID=UPI0012195F02|nr:hypothetical protein [Mesorhizobium sp.]TIL41894.1 MAG: hypothetical protein E5Y86_30110 [Mesorhizobium sp.]
MAGTTKITRRGALSTFSAGTASLVIAPALPTIDANASEHLVRENATDSIEINGAKGPSRMAHNVSTYDSKSNASAAEIEEGVKVIETQFLSPSYTRPRTLVGGARYRRESLANLRVFPPAGCFRSLDRFMPDGTIDAINGGYWIIAEPKYYPDQFGAIHGTGCTLSEQLANCAALQAMVDAIIYGAAKATANLRSDVLEYYGTLHLGYGDRTHGCGLTGAGRNYRGQDQKQGSALIHAGPITQQAINFQGIRNVTLQGFTLIGMLFSAMNDLTGDKTDVSVWNALGGDDRHAPYAGITGDAFTGERPSTSYPNTDYPAWTGVTGAYNKAGSSNPNFVDVEISGFNSGYINNPSASNNNCDFPTFQRCRIEHCAYALSIGNSQCRNLHIDGMQIYRVHTILTTKKHGAQNGRLGGVVTDMSVGEVAQLLDINLGAVTGTFKLQQFYGENIWRFGDAGRSGSDTSPIRIEGGSWKLDWFATYGRPAWFCEGTTLADITFQDVDFNGYDGVLTFQPTNVHFETISNRPNKRSSTVRRYIAHARNALAGGIVTNDRLQPHAQRIRYKVFDTDTGALLIARMTDESNVCITRNFNVPDCQYRLGWKTDIDHNIIDKPRLYSSRHKTYFTSIDLSGTLLKLVTPAIYWHDAMLLGYMPGDVIFDIDTGSTFFIRAFNGPTNGGGMAVATILAELQNNLRSGGGQYVVFSNSIGNFEFINGRIFVSKTRLFAASLTSSADLTDVGNAARIFDNGVAEAIRVGDCSLEPRRDCVFSETQSVVVALDTSARTITMSGKALRTIAYKDYSLWIKWPPANI